MKLSRSFWKHVNERTHTPAKQDVQLTFFGRNTRPPILVISSETAKHAELEILTI